MKRFHVTIVTAALALSACGGGTPPGGGAGTVPNAVAPAFGSSQASQPEIDASNKHRAFVKTAFFLTVPKHRHKHHERGGMHPGYISAGSASIVISLLAVAGGASPPPGLLTQTTTNLTNCSSGCTVYGPAVPVGQDQLELQIFDAQNGTGNVLSEQDQTFTISPGVQNNLSVVLEGVPASFTLGVPAGNADTASTPAVSFAALDADGDTISGTYWHPVTISTNDATGAAPLALNGGMPATSVQTQSSTDSIALTYSGLAIPSPTLTASATGATQATATFVVHNQNPSSTCSDGGALICATTPTNPTINLYATSGTGSSATLLATQAGFTDSPYGKTISESDNCSAIATVGSGPATPSPNGTQFTVATAAGASAPGSCTITLTGGDPTHKSESVTVTYTTSGIGVNARHARARKAKP